MVLNPIAFPLDEPFYLATKHYMFFMLIFSGRQLNIIIIYSSYSIYKCIFYNTYFNILIWILCCFETI